MQTHSKQTINVSWDSFFWVKTNMNSQHYAFTYPPNLSTCLPTYLVFQVEYNNLNSNHPVFSLVNSLWLRSHWLRSSLYNEKNMLAAAETRSHGPFAREGNFGSSTPLSHPFKLNNMLVFLNLNPRLFGDLAIYRRSRQSFCYRFLWVRASWSFPLKIWTLNGLYFVSKQ